MSEGIVRWGIYFTMLDRGNYNIGMNIGSQNWNGERTFTLSVSLLFFYIEIGRIVD